MDIGTPGCPWLINQSITSMTNGLRHGMQFGVPVTEELVTVCVVMRADAGRVN